MTAPFMPQNVVLQTGNGQNLVSWPIVVGATSYNIQRSTDGLNFVTLGSSVSPFYLDSAVTVGNEYYYQVASVNGSDVSPYTQSYPPLITPCLPGQINLGYLRYQAQLKADKLNSEYITLDEWNFNLNNSTDELYDIITLKFGEDYNMAPPLYIPLTGLEKYPLPDGSNYSGAPAIYKLMGVDANVSGAAPGINAGWVPLARANWSDRDRYTTFPGQAGALNNIYQMSYREMGNDLWIFPANQNQLLRVTYVPIRRQLLLDTDMLPFGFSAWWEYVSIDTAIKVMDKEESFEKVQSLEKKKMFLIERIESAAANRDVGQPNSVSNVRATMGDPGFSNWGNGYGGGGFGGGGMWG